MSALDSAKPKTEVIPFARLSPGALDGVLAAQRGEWLDRLEWEIGEITEFVSDAIRGRSLKGGALLVDDEVAGFGFFTIEVDRCLIGELYVSPAYRTPDTDAALVHGVIRLIRQTRPRKRVESQAIVFEPSGFDRAFAEHGFVRHDREYLVADLASSAPDDVTEHPRVEVRSWIDKDFSGATEVVYQSYRGTVDGRMNIQYRTREGCADLLDALTDSPWCGRFDPEVARVAVDRLTGRCCGVAVGSVISERTAHFGQISVHPVYQNEGIGRAMVGSAMVGARRLGLERATLAVTRENRGAAKLYHELGFRPKLEFPVYTRDAAPFRNRTR